MSAALRAEARVDGTELARIIHNVLAVVPARTHWPAIQLSLGTEGVSALASDTYVVFTDSAAIEGYDGPPAGLAMTIGSKDAAVIERIARMDKKGIGLLEVHPDDSTVYRPEFEEQEPAAALAITEERYAGLWKNCESALERLEPDPEAVLSLGPLALQPVYLAALNKVKAQPDPVADLYISGPNDPVVVKIGPTFRAAIMPITRDKARPDDLWE